MKISGVYKITNAITGDFYIGSSKDVKQRWAYHKCKSIWNEQPNNQMYLDMKNYGLDKFSFQILAEVEVDKLKEMEQRFIETLKPTYNRCNAKGIDVERKKKYNKEYRKTDKSKEYHKKYQKSDKGKKYQKKYQKSDKGKKAQKKYHNQLCLYNGEILTLNALSSRFRRRGIEHPVIEAKKYLL